MSLTTGQKEYLLELLSHEYVLTEDQQLVIRQAICQYATTVYDQQELDFLISMPQSLAACLYYQGGKQSFSRQYALWLNCLEHSIYQEIDGLQAVLINPDPTSSQKILAIVEKEECDLEVIPLPQLKFINQQQTTDCSRWTLIEARESFFLFMQYAHNSSSYTQTNESMTWTELLQQARLFTMVKETYVFSGRAAGLPKPSTWQQLNQLTVPHTPKATNKRSWIYQPPANPFSAEMKLAHQVKQSFSSLQQNKSFHLPEFPAPPRFSFGALPPFPFAPKRK